MGFAVPQSQTDKSAPGMGVRVGRSLARQIGKEDQAFTPRGNLFCRLGQEFVCILPSPILNGLFLSAQIIFIPLERTSRRQHNSHQMPFTGNGMTKCMQFSLWFHTVLIALSKNDPTCTKSCRNHTFLNYSASNSLSRLVSSTRNNWGAYG